MSKILIEVVSNGFIVKEDYIEQYEPRMQGHASISVIKVFNTKRQLNKYINETLNPEIQKPCTQ